jgi:hypothetical protein
VADVLAPPHELVVQDEHVAEAPAGLPGVHEVLFRRRREEADAWGSL